MSGPGVNLAPSRRTGAPARAGTGAPGRRWRSVTPFPWDAFPSPPLQSAGLRGVVGESGAVGAVRPAGRSLSQGRARLGQMPMAGGTILKFGSCLFPSPLLLPLL